MDILILANKSILIHISDRNLSFYDVSPSLIDIEIFLSL